MTHLPLRPLRLEALEPLIKRCVEITSARLPQSDRSSKIIAMLCVLQHVAEDIVLILAFAALGRLGECLGVGCPWLAG